MRRLIDVYNLAAKMYSCPSYRNLKIESTPYRVTLARCLCTCALNFKKHKRPKMCADERSKHSLYIKSYLFRLIIIK
jgi:hypothetical protein